MPSERKGSALVTGAGVRIGRAIAIDLATHGYDVAVHYNTSSEGAADTSREIEKAGRRALPLQADLADGKACLDLVSRAREGIGDLNVLVNNASIFRRDVVEDLTIESWNENLDVNLRAPMLLMQAFAQALPADRKGNIVNIIDQKVWRLTPFYLSYTVAKAGLWTLTRTMAQALAPNVRVNAIGPGPVMANTEMTAAEFEVRWQSMPLERGASPTDLCNGIRYLLSADAMTGQMLALDGGQHLIYSSKISESE